MLVLDIHLFDMQCNKYFFLCNFFIEIYLIYNIVLVSGVQQGNSVIYIYIYFRLFSIISYYNEYSFLCYTVNPCCLSSCVILNYTLIIFLMATPIIWKFPGQRLNPRLCSNLLQSILNPLCHRGDSLELHFR